EGAAAGGGHLGALAFFGPGPRVGPKGLLDGRGGRPGLLVREGFRGIYEVGEQARPYGPAIFDVMYDKPPMLVPRSLTGEVCERVDFRGEVLRPLEEEALRTTLRAMVRLEPASIAACLPVSVLPPPHEPPVGRLLPAH